MVRIILGQFVDKRDQAGFFISGVVFMNNAFPGNRVDCGKGLGQQGFGLGPSLTTFDLFNLGFHFGNIAFVLYVLLFRLPDTFFFRGLSLHACPFQDSQKVVKFIKKPLETQKKKPRPN
jgi:hypothetical protein